MEKRKTGKDYRKEYNDIKKSEMSLSSHTVERVLELVKIYPEAIITKKSGVEIKAKSITREWLESVSMETRISYIEIIEEWSSVLHGHKQLKF
jgi:hypothetical protein